MKITKNWNIFMPCGWRLRAWALTISSNTPGPRRAPNPREHRNPPPNDLVPSTRRAEGEEADSTLGVDRNNNWGANNSRRPVGDKKYSLKPRPNPNQSPTRAKNGYGGLKPGRLTKKTPTGSIPAGKILFFS